MRFTVNEMGAMDKGQHFTNDAITESENPNLKMLNGAASEIYDMNSIDNSIAKRNIATADHQPKNEGLGDDLIGGMQNFNSTENMSKGIEDVYKSSGGVSKRNLNKKNTAPVLENVLMQVNKYVHPCERLPSFIQNADQEKFKLDYEKKENERIKAHL